MPTLATATVTNPTAAVTDFSLLVDLSTLPQAWWDAVDTTDPTKGRAFKGDGTTELACDWIEFDDVAETGQVRVKWSGTLASSGTQELKIQAPEAATASYAAGDTYGQYAAYDSATKAYLPLSETTGGSFGDRTSNGVLFDTINGTLPNPVAGPTGTAQNFDDATPDRAASNDLNTVMNVGATFTVELVARVDTLGDHNAFLSTTGSAGTDTLWMHIGYRSSGDIGLRGWNASTGSALCAISTSFNDTTSFHHIAATSSTTTTWGLFVDGVEALGSVNATTANGSGLTVLGSKSNSSSDPLDGQLAHVRFSDTVRSDAWIVLENEQTTGNATFWGTWTASGDNDDRSASADRSLPSLGRSNTTTFEEEATSGDPVETGVTWNETITPGVDWTPSSGERNDTLLVQGTATFPVSPTDSFLLECGASGDGMWIGVRDSATWFRLRFGNGGTSATGGNDLGASTAQLDLPIGLMPFDGSTHEFAAEYDNLNYTIRVWMDNELIADTAQTLPAGAYANGGGKGQWAGTDEGDWLDSNSINVCSGEPNTNWTGGTAGSTDLNVAYNQLSGWTEGTAVGEYSVSAPRSLPSITRDSTATHLDPSAIPDRTSTVQKSVVNFLDIFYGGNAASVNKDGIYNVLSKDGYLWVGHGSSNTATPQKTVAMRISDGVMGAFDAAGNFYVPTVINETPASEWFLTLAENGIMYRSPDGVAQVMGDSQGENFKYANVIPGVSADKSVTIVPNGGHARGAFTLGNTILHQVENDEPGGIQFRVSEDAGATWRAPVTSVITSSQSYTRPTFFEYGGDIYLFEEWRPGDTGTEAAEKAILRFRPGHATEEFEVIVDNHSDIAPWSHYLFQDTIFIPGVGNVEIEQDFYPGVESLVYADSQFYLGLKSGLIGKTSSLSTTPSVQIADPASTYDEYGNPNQDIYYFGHRDRLYALVADDGEIFLYNSGSDTWTLNRTVTLGFVPNRFDYDEDTRIMALGSGNSVNGYVATFEAFDLYTGDNRSVSSDRTLPALGRSNAGFLVVEGSVANSSRTLGLSRSNTATHVLASQTITSDRTLSALTRTSAATQVVADTTISSSRTLPALGRSNTAFRDLQYDLVVQADNPINYWYADSAGLIDRVGQRDAPLVGTGVVTSTGDMPVGLTAVDALVCTGGGGAATPDIYTELDAHAEWTWEVWVRVDGDLSNTDESIMSMFNGPNDRMLWMDVGDGAVGFAVYWNDGTSHYSGHTKNSGISGQWHHVVGRQTATTLDLWVDNVLIDSISQTATAVQPARILEFGSAASNSQRFLNGAIARPASYDYALSDARIEAHYSAGIGVQDLYTVDSDRTLPSLGRDSAAVQAEIPPRNAIANRVLPGIIKDTTAQNLGTSDQVLVADRTLPVLGRSNVLDYTPPDYKPVVTSPIPDVTGEVGDANYVVNLNTIFSDPEALSLTFTVQSGTSASIVGPTLTVSKATAISEVVVIRATDPGGGFVQDTFTVNINTPIVSGAGDLPAFVQYRIRRASDDLLLGSSATTTVVLVSPPGGTYDIYSEAETVGGYVLSSTAVQGPVVPVLYRIRKESDDTILAVSATQPITLSDPPAGTYNVYVETELVGGTRMKSTSYQVTA